MRKAVPGKEDGTPYGEKAKIEYGRTGAKHRACDVPSYLWVCVYGGEKNE